MSATVKITDTETGESRLFEDENFAGTYIWSDGNYSCDCNRHLFFKRAHDEDESGAECGEGRYRVDSIYADGVLFYSEAQTEQ